MGELPMERYAAALIEQADQLATLLHDADLGRQVPTCPEWDLRQLVVHLGRAHRFGADVVRRQVMNSSDVAGLSTFPVPDASAALSGWLVDGAGELVDAVRSAGADQPTWNYLGVDLQAGFWLRRMAHETTVHRVDAALTVHAPWRLDPDLAADGISEWLSILGSPDATAYRPEWVEQLRGDGQTLHLHATDSPSLGESGEWLILRGPEGLSWEHGHRKADVAVRGLAGDLLLALLGRIPTDDERLRVFGDVGLFEHWVRYFTF
ncbi:MAG: maleylpyruvate isomerase family mycothiol-dependent enzyme [Pseudonocardia sp.]|nr:maleylpyruvate isomerase family mycothiol-dependent enzyme [Pseudonocardia sp.]